MSNNTPRAVDSKHKRDEALAVADFKIDDILSVPGDQLLAEVAEDFGDPAFLAAEFDSIALPAMSTHDMSRVNRRAMATLRVQPASSGTASVRAFPRSPRRSFFRATLAILAERPVVVLRRRIILGTFATLLLMAALAPSIYPLLVNRSADRITTVSQDKPLTQLPAATSSGPLSTKNPAPGGLGSQSPVAPEPTHVSPQPAPAEPKPLRTVTEENNRAAGLLAGRQVSPRPSESVASRARAARIAASPPAIAGALPAAKPRVSAGDGFFVQLSSPKSEAEALSALLALKSEYAVLKGYELEIRRKDEGERGVIYSVQVGPFESHDDAEQLCVQLKTAGGICVVTSN